MWLDSYRNVLLPLSLVFVASCTDSTGSSTPGTDANTTDPGEQDTGTLSDVEPPRDGATGPAINLLFVNEADDLLAPNLPSRNGASMFADLDGDGHTDVVRVGDNGVEIWWNAGDATFTKAEKGSIAPPSGLPEDKLLLRWRTPVTAVVAVESQEPGKQHILVLCEGASPVRLLVNQSGRYFKETDLSWMAKNPPQHASVADFDGDGHVDLLITERPYPVSDSETGAALFIHTSDAGYVDNTSVYLHAPRVRAWASAVGDMDNDGDIDIVFSGVNQPHRLVLNDGGGHLRDAPIPAFGVDGNPNGRGIAAGDIDGDGYWDVLVASATANQVWINQKNGRFSDQSDRWLESDPWASDIAVLADLNRDGRLDAIFAGLQSAVRVLRTNGEADWVDSSQHIVPLPPQQSDVKSVHAADIDGDGDLDVLLGRGAMARGWLLRNWHPNAFDDEDFDGVPDAIDNCPNVPNPDQANMSRYPFSCDSERTCWKKYQCRVAYFDDSAYLICPNEIPWSQAHQFCKKLGTHLVKIETQRENYFLANQGLRAVWIGLTCDNDRVFHWTDGEVVAATFWAKYQPNNAGGHEQCVTLNNWGPSAAWNDVVCTKVYGFICEDRALRKQVDPGDLPDACTPVEGD